MPPLPNQLFERWAMDILHHQIILTRLFKKIENRHRVGVYQRRGRTCFTPVTFDRLAIILMQRAQHLHRDKTFDTVVTGLKNAGHATRSYMFANLIASTDEPAVKLI